MGLFLVKLATMRTITSHADMVALGENLGGQLQAGDLILLSGSLGAGKTAFTQGIAAALGIAGVTSPTFVISRIHAAGSAGIALVHVDAYRLQGEASAIFDDLDLESYLPTSITVVEWGDGLIERLSDIYLEIQLGHGHGENDRTVQSVGHGERWQGFEL